MPHQLASVAAQTLGQWQQGEPQAHVCLAADSLPHADSVQSAPVSLAQQNCDAHLSEYAAAARAHPLFLTAAMRSALSKPQPHGQSCQHAVHAVQVHRALAVTSPAWLFCRLLIVLVFRFRC